MAKGERFKRLALQRSKQQGISYSKARKQLRQKAMVSPQETLMSNLDRNAKLTAVRVWLASNLYGVREHDRTFSSPSEYVLELLELSQDEFWVLLADCPELAAVRAYNACSDLTAQNLLALLQSPYLTNLRSLFIQLRNLSLGEILQILYLPSLTSLESIDLLDNGTLKEGSEDPLENGYGKAQYTVTNKKLGGDAFRHLPNLKSIFLEEGYTMDPELIARLGERCPKLETFRVSDTVEGDAILKAFSETGFSLSSLSVPENEISPRGIQHLVKTKGLASLKELRLHYNPLGNEGAVLLATYAHLFENLEVLTLEGCEIGDAGATALASAPFPSLKTLELGFNDIGDAGALALCRGTLIGQLKDLSLKENPIGPMEISHLEMVWLSNYHTSEAIWAARKGTYPGLKVGRQTGLLEDLPRG